jgi:hypothetical protein
MVVIQYLVHLQLLAVALVAELMDLLAVAEAVVEILQV